MPIFKEMNAKVPSAAAKMEVTLDQVIAKLQDVIDIASGKKSGNLSTAWTDFDSLTTNYFLANTKSFTQGVIEAQGSFNTAIYKYLDSGSTEDKNSTIKAAAALLAKLKALPPAELDNKPEN